MNISKITSSPIMKKIGKGANKVADKVGDFVDKNKFTQKIVDFYEPNGGDNSFAGLASIMVFAVLIPRIKTALQRNPENKEATKDEITGILLRDVTTILTVLFALKSMNTIAGNIATKVSGIPMVDKPYQKLFKEGAETFSEKAGSAIKATFSNIKDTLHPIGGSKMLNAAQIDDIYTGNKGVDGTQKFLDALPSRGGKPEVAFKKIQNSIVDTLSQRINKLELEHSKLDDKFTPDVEENINRTKKLLEYFKELTYETFMDINKVQDDGSVVKMQQEAEDELTKFFSDKKNSIAKIAKTVNAWMKTLVLGIEVFFLGFGLPSIIQNRLEKKYLTEQPIGTIENGNFVPLNDKNIKAQEIKLYSSFMK